MNTQIKFDDDHLVNALGKGTITIVTKKDEKIDTHDFYYYVQSPKHNLLSVGQLNENVFEFKFKGPTCTILDRQPSQRVIARIQMTNNKMFPLVIKIVNHSLPYAQFVTSYDETWLWHLRYGHLAFNKLNILRKKSMVLGLLVIGVHHKPWKKLYACQTPKK